jgi:hypothetical protein
MLGVAYLFSSRGIEGSMRWYISLARRSAVYVDLLFLVLLVLHLLPHLPLILLGCYSIGADIYWGRMMSTIINRTGCSSRPEEIHP